MTEAPPPSNRWRPLGRYARALALPVLLWVLVLVALREPVGNWLRGEDNYDEAALKEWLDEARGFRETLPEMVESYRGLRANLRRLEEAPSSDPFEKALARQAVNVKHEEIRMHLENLGVPATKIYPGLLPLFPVFYRLEVRLDEEPDAPIVWDSEQPVHEGQYQELRHRLGDRAAVLLRYQLHAYDQRQRAEQGHQRRTRQLSLLAVAATLFAGAWVVVTQRRERNRDLQKALAASEIERAQRLLAEEERRREETERQLLQQQLATRDAERQALELKSQLYASIGIMAGSYAHNIKNLLVRPNDLLRRCLEADGLSGEQETMLHEVKETLGTVTERLQQILRTVRRDPTRTEHTVFDLHLVLRDLGHTWRDLARDKWKVELELDLTDDPRGVRVAADLSHVQQVVENLLFNARDAVFEQRSRLRDGAHRAAGLEARKAALLAAAAWRGRVVLRTRRAADAVVLEVEDNGAGMTEEVRRRCTETHYSTKRDNALYEGHSTGMGLGLSFVVTILEYHRAALEVVSEPGRGALFRVTFPAAPAEPAAPSANGAASSV